MNTFLLRFLIGVMLMTFGAAVGRAENWPRWRGPDGNAVSQESPLPVRWGPEENVRCKAPVLGEGSSSPVVWEDRVFLTSARDDGTRRVVHCFHRDSGKRLWSREVEDDFPEITSALTGHAAPTPVTDGRRVLAFFGNAGLVCCDLDGRQLWRRRFGDFETELGLASSPVLNGGSVLLLCDHDGTRFTSFDSFLIALDVRTGETRWKTPRPDVGRSWSTPILVPGREGQRELVAAAENQVRGYDPKTGKQLWHVDGLTGWVAPSPVFADGMIYATSGRNGPVTAVRPGGRGDVTETRVAWRHPTGGPYVCSPLLYGEELYVHNGRGILTCYKARTGERVYRKRLDGRFYASGVAGDGKVFLTNTDGTTFVIDAGTTGEILAENALGEYSLASPAISDNSLFLRTESHLYRIGGESNADDPSTDS